MGAIRWQPELGACLVHGRRRELDRLCLRPREPEADPENRDPMALGEKFGAELPALAHDHVGMPALDEITEGGQLGANVEPGEELPDHRPVVRCPCPSRRTRPSAASTHRGRAHRPARTGGRDARHCPRTDAGPRRERRARPERHACANGASGPTCPELPRVVKRTRMGSEKGGRRGLGSSDPAEASRRASGCRPWPPHGRGRRQTT